MEIATNKTKSNNERKELTAYKSYSKTKETQLN